MPGCALLARGPQVRGSFLRKVLREAKREVLAQNGPLYGAIPYGFDLSVRFDLKGVLKVLARLLTPEGGKPGYACFTWF